METVSTKKTEVVCLPIPHAPAMPIPFNTTGQHLPGGAIIECSKLSSDIERRIERAG